MLRHTLCKVKQSVASDSPIKPLAAAIWGGRRPGATVVAADFLFVRREEPDSCARRVEGGTVMLRASQRHPGTSFFITALRLWARVASPAGRRLLRAAFAPSGPDGICAPARSFLSTAWTWLLQAAAWAIPMDPPSPGAVKSVTSPATRSGRVRRSPPPLRQTGCPQLRLHPQIVCRSCGHTALEACSFRLTQPSRFQLPLTTPTN